VFRELAGASVPRPAAAGAGGGSPLSQRLLSLAPSAAEDLMLDLVRSEAAHVLGIASPDLIRADQSLESLGLDSLMEVELNNRLSTAVGSVLPIYLIRENGTLRNLSRVVLERLLMRIATIKSPEGEVSFEGAHADDYQQEIL